MGDWGMYGLLHQQLVANQMETFAAGLTHSFLVMAGDNFYQAGISSVTDPSMEPVVQERIYRVAPTVLVLRGAG
jgi:tartrate-resistant acid phosphatase type 5